MSEETRENTRVESVLDDPGAIAIARVYADAFLDALSADQAAEALDEFAAFVYDIVQKNPEFARMLDSAMVGRDEKQALIERVLRGRASDLFVNFLHVLVQHERLGLLTQIFQQSQQRHEIRVGARRVQVTSARPLSAESLQSIQQSLAKSLPYRPIIEADTDPKLLGGLRIRVGDTVYDSSLRTRLKQLAERLRKRSIHEIQSGRNRFSHPAGD